MVMLGEMLSGLIPRACICCVYAKSVYMLWFNFILGLNLIFLCFKVIIIHYHTPKQRKIKFKPRIKLDYNIYIWFFKTS